MKIVLLGGTGTLGQELLRIDNRIIAPTRLYLDINEPHSIEHYINQVKPDVIIHAAAETSNVKISKFPAQAVMTNIIATAHISNLCMSRGIRLVYISTDYVYKGDRGNYKETDEILPSNLYSWTKLGGECSVKCVKNHLIIRTSFGKNTFDYSEAFTDKWTSKDYVEFVAPMIYDAAVSPLIGVLNLGTDRKTIYDYAVLRNKDVKGVKTADTSFSTPYDTSMNLQKWIDYNNDRSIAKPHCNCRVCGSDKLTKYLDLGIMPLANNLEFTSVRAKEKERFPLQVMFCEDCGLSQLSVVIDPSKMFSYYTYRSSVNGGYVKHCRKMAERMQKDLKLNENSFVIDIAGNDGALLREFKSVIPSLKVLNVDPATNLTAIAEASGIPCVTDFWSPRLAIKILEDMGEADLITATNVFAHVDNVSDFIKGAVIALKRGTGILMLEFPYLVDFIEGNEFDTVYFEHLSYFSIIPLSRLCENLGMQIVNVERQSIHGGTVRVSICDKFSEHKVDQSVHAFIRREMDLGFNTIRKYLDWSVSIKGIIDEFSMKILDLKRSGKKVAAFAASAKGNTLLCSAGMDTDVISYIADETPEKIGKFSPTTGIPIVNKAEIINSHPDYIIILSWNFKDEIIAKLNKIYNGKYIIPLPSFEIIQANDDQF